MTTLLSAPPAKAAPSNSEGGHWYECKGIDWTPLYKDGGTFTLREARALKEAGDVVCPSVTTIFKGLHKPQLQRWLMEQTAKACRNVDLALPEADYVETALSIANNGSKGAMNLGTDIHKAIELALENESWNVELDPYVRPVLQYIEVNQLAGQSELCCGSKKYGYAGRCDFSGNLTVADFKSRKGGRPTKAAPGRVAVYSTDKMQLAAYGFALYGNDYFTKGTGIVFGISTSEPGAMTPHVFTGAELVQAFEAFLALCTVWRYENNLDPRVQP